MKNIGTRRLIGLPVLLMLLTTSTGAEAGALWKAARQASLNKSKATTTAPAPAPRVTTPAEKPHVVVVRRSKTPHTAAHIDQAQRQGQPSVLHIERSHADQRRRESIGSVDPQRRPGPHYDRDEYPPAFTAQGGANSNVRHIPASDNRSAGASMGAQTRGLPNGSKIQIVVID